MIITHQPSGSHGTSSQQPAASGGNYCAEITVQLLFLFNFLGGAHVHLSSSQKGQRVLPEGIFSVFSMRGESERINL